MEKLQPSNELSAEDGEAVDWKARDKEDGLRKWRTWKGVLKAPQVSSPSGAVGWYRFTVALGWGRGRPPQHLDWVGGEGRRVMFVWK